MSKNNITNQHAKSSRPLLGELGALLPIVIGLTAMMIQLLQTYQKQKSTILLFFGAVLLALSTIFWRKSIRTDGRNKMKRLVIPLLVTLLGLAACASVFFLPTPPLRNQLLDIFENRNLNGSIVLAFYNKNKDENNLIKSSIGELKVVIFKKLNNDSVEIIYKPEIDPSGITIISELTEGEYCIGISFFGIILDYVENVNVDYNRFEFVELILKNPQGIIRFEALDSSNFPLSNIYFEIRSTTEQPFRGWKTGKDGKTLDFWIYSLTEKSIGSYYAVAEIEDANEIRHEVWRSKSLRPFFKHEGDKYETIRAIINLENQ
jgi:hypothetical protein